MRYTKIVCTLGPASSSAETIAALVEAGMDVARLNFSHGDHDSHRETFARVHAAAERHGRPVAVLADLSGPKLRIGPVAGDMVRIAAGDRIVLTSDEVMGTAERVGLNHADLPREVDAGASLFIDDGRLELVVEETSDTELACRVVVGGPLRSRKGLNLPQARLSLPALTDKDREDLHFARELGVDYLALSFVRRAADLREAQDLAGDIPVIAKIEKPEAIERLAEVADAADGLMVARGDLGIEVGFEKVPILQKRIIDEAVRRNKPVITATQMLESMVERSKPTRAEVSDVANAVLDGTDAVMLSAETAAGKYPVESVRTMARIIREVERSEMEEGLLRQPAVDGALTLENAIAHATAQVARDLEVKAAVVFSRTGRSIALTSSYRPATPIVGVSQDPAVLRRTALFWGTVPLPIDWKPELADMVAKAEGMLLGRGLAEHGDAITVTFGQDGGGPMGMPTLHLTRLRPEAVPDQYAEMGSA